jgi:hypothetical protein
MANCLMNGSVVKTNNMFFKNEWMSIKSQTNELADYTNTYAKTLYRPTEKN